MKTTHHSLPRIIAVLILALSFSALFANRPGDKVGVSVENLMYDFGTINNESPNVHHTFTITNTSSEAVAILSASASCGCTKPKYQKKPLRPGESTTIDVTFVPKDQKGEISKDIKVKLKNAQGKTESITFRLKGVVVPAKK